jgi:hypothetical protein
MIILDTNVLSELMRPSPSPLVVGWIEQQPPDQVFTTSITEAEIFYGIRLLATGKRRDALLVAAEAIFIEHLSDRVIAFESLAAHAFARIAAKCRNFGKPISHADAQIAAIVQTHRATLATRNVADFANCDILIANPWIAAK